MTGEQLAMEPSTQITEAPVVLPSPQEISNTPKENGPSERSRQLDMLKVLADEAKVTGHVGDQFEEQGKEYLAEMIQAERPADNIWTSKGQEPKGLLLVDDNKTITTEIAQTVKNQRKEEQKKRDDDKKAKKGAEAGREVSQDVRMKVPDTLVIGLEPASGAVVVRACDFKMHMGYARQEQVHPKAVISLMNGSVAARRSLEAQIKVAVGKVVRIPDDVSLDQTGKRLMLGDDVVLDSGFFLTVATEDNTNHFEAMDTLRSTPGELRGRVTRDRALIMALDDTEVDAFFEEIHTSDGVVESLLEAMPLGIEPTEDTTYFDQAFRRFRAQEVASSLIEKIIETGSLSSKEIATKEIVEKAVSAGCQTQMDLLNHLDEQAKLAVVRQKLARVIENKVNK